MKTAIICLVLVVLGATGGGLVQGWRKDAKIADLKREQADARADQYKGALDDLATASRRINDAAASARLDLSTVTGQLATIRKEFKDAKPLPADCRPDTPRVRKLTAAARAVDQAVAGSVTGSAVPAERPAGGR